MFDVLDIVTFDNLIFTDGIKDPKTDRPCAVIYRKKLEDEDDALIFCVPMTSNVKALNKSPKKHALISEAIYNSRKFSIAKLDRLFIERESNAKNTGKKISNVDKENIIRKMHNLKNKDRVHVLMFKYMCFDEGLNQKNDFNRELDKRIKRRKLKKFNS